MTSLCITYKQRTWRGLELVRSEEVQKCKFVENCVRIDGRCVPDVAAAETAI